MSLAHYRPQRVLRQAHLCQIKGTRPLTFSAAHFTSQQQIQRDQLAAKSRRQKDQLPVIPIVAIFCLGSAAFYFLVKSREGQGKGAVVPEKAPSSKDQWPRSTGSDQTLSRR